MTATFQNKEFKARKPPGPVTIAYLERAALYYLERFSATAQSLRRVLTQKVDRRCRLRSEDANAYRALIDEVVAKAVASGLANDEAYAQSKVSSLRRRGSSARQIVAKLKAKGVDADMVDAILDQEGTDDLTAARALARRRKLGPWRLKDRSAFRHKDMASLGRAGFSFDIARQVIDAQETEEVI